MDPWDMSQSTDLYPSGFGDQPGKGWNNPVVANGVFNGWTQAPISYLWLLYHGFPTMNPVDLHNGLINPINADKYRYLTFRLYLQDPDPDVPVRVWWSKAGNEVSGPCGASTMLVPYAGWHIYRLDLATNAMPGKCPWDGQITGLLLSPTSTDDANYKGKMVALDWARLSDPTSATPVAVTWNLGNVTGQRSVSLLLDDDNQPANGVLDTLATGLPSDATGSYAWGLKGLSPGTYYIHARASSDYAGSVLGDPWDFQQASDYAGVYNLSNVTLANGILQATSTSIDPQIWLSVPVARPIDATLYRKLFVRINVNAPSDVQALWTHAGETHAQNYSQFIHVDPGWQTIAVDLECPMVGSWSGDITSLRLDPGLAAGVTYEIDWVALTTGVVPQTESDLLPALFPNIATVTINQAPLLRFRSPSRESGQDYAATVLGAPWDFDDGSSLTETHELAGASFNGDSMLGVTAQVHNGCIGANDCGDPYFFFRISRDPTRFINPNRFKYLTLRYWQEGVFSFGQGWIWRPVWRAAPPFSGGLDMTVSNGIQVHDAWPSYTEADGWFTYQLDLRNTAPEPGGGTTNWGWNDSHGWISQFRIDPTEVAAATRFHLRRVLLTADPVATGGPFTISWDWLNSDGTATISAYYTTDKNAPTQRAIGTVQQPAANLTWDTSGVPDGTYYIYLKANDGYNTTGIFSDVPVVVQRPPSVTLNVPGGAVLHGSDYATDVLGDAWDMSDSNGIAQVRDGTPPVFAGGVMSFISTGAAPQVYLKIDPAHLIDASQYKMLVFKMYSSLPGLARVVWTGAGGQDATTDFFDTQSGWHVYRMDLGANPAWTGSIGALHIDPAQSTNITVQFDWVKLVISGSAPYFVTWTSQRAAGARLALFATTAAGAGDSWSLATNLDAAQGAATLDLSALEPGSYNLYAELDNQVNATVRTSPAGAVRVARQQQPTIELAPITLNFYAFTRPTMPTGTALSLYLDNTGVTDYEWAAASDLSWMTVTPSSGSHQPVQLNVHVQPPDGTPPGTYHGHITVTAPGVGTRVADVTIVVVSAKMRLALPLIRR
jgi:hypothetical protein